MRLRPFIHVAILALLCPGVLFYSGNAGAQMIDFGQIDSFESMGTGTQTGGSRPKTIVDDGEWHTVLFTILDSSTDAKIYWRSPDGDQTTIIRGPSVKAFQTAGTFKVEALGNENQSFKYGYVLFRLKNNRGI
ncbi:MAG TPA: hypothetical protein VFI94_06360 [Pseudolabrys sp.]|nr:hypothetical protein [Pseudolabrys sp.]